MRQKLEIKQRGGAFEVRVRGGFLRLDWYTDRIVRVRAWAKGPPPAGHGRVVVARPEKGLALQARSGENGSEIRGAALQVLIDADGRLRFNTADGRRLLWEGPDGRRFTRDPGARQGLRDGCEQRWQLGGDESLYGLGQHQDDRLDWRNRSCTMLQSNTVIPVPYVWSTAGWGLLWDNLGRSEFADDVAGMRWRSDVADAVDYYLIYGPSPDALIAGYRHLTGRVPLFPRWVLGYWQSKERYKSADELAGVVDEFRRRGLPLDVIVQDWQYWGDSSQWSSLTYDPAVFGDLPGAVRRVHDRHARVLVSVWPTPGPQTRVAAGLDRLGALFNAVTWNSGRIYDVFNPKARALYWRHARKGLWELGIDGWWMDATEPEFGSNSWRPDEIHAAALKDRDSAAGPLAKHLCAYPLAATAAMWEGQRAASHEKRVVNLTRAGWAGQQRQGTIVWSGDISASWDTLRRQVASGLDLCMAGLPWWTSDGGAFFASNARFGARFTAPAHDDPAYRELYLRWMQFAAACPVMRSHGTDCAREPWRFGEPGTWCHDGLVTAMRLRYRLLPYLEALMARTTFQHDTIMRALVMDFPDDPRVRRIADQFMLGPALMACPVLRPQAHAAPGEPLTDARRTVYFPAGGWYDFWTGARIEGGRWVEIATPLERLPLFVRAGAILPLGPDRQWVDDQPEAPVELRLYPGADGAFALYEDAGDGYAYEDGEYAWIPLAWNEAARALTIGACAGKRPAPRAVRRFVVTTGAAGLETAPGVALDWTGRALTQVLDSVPHGGAATSH